MQWRRNQIRTLQAADNTLVTDHAPKAAILHAFYSELLGQADDCITMPNLASTLSCTALTTGQANALIGPFTLEELKVILFSMKTDTTPGPDCFTPLFFRENWDLVKHDLLAFLNVFHGGTADIECINKATGLSPCYPKERPHFWQKTTGLSPCRIASPRFALKA